MSEIVKPAATRVDCANLRSQPAKVGTDAKDQTSSMIIHALEEMQSEHIMQIKEILSDFNRKQTAEMNKRQSDHEERITALVKGMSASSSLYPASPGGKVKKSGTQSFPQAFQNKKSGSAVDSTLNVVKPTQVAPIVPVEANEPEAKKSNSMIASTGSVSGRSSSSKKSSGPKLESEQEVQSVKKNLGKVQQLARALSSVDDEVDNCRASLRRLFDHPVVDVCICIVILANTIFVAAQADYVAKNLEEASSDEWYGMNMFFLCFFLFEIIIRIVVERQDFIFGHNRHWNIFDFFVSFISLIEVLISSASNTRAVRVLRILRIIRVARFLRVLRFFHELRAMVMGILHSFGTLIWVLVLLCMNMFLFAVYVTQIAAYERIEMNNAVDKDEELDAALEENFGELTSSMYSLYKAVTGGDDWGGFADLLFEVNIFTGLLFCFYVAFTTFAVLNVVTGVFIGNAFKLIEDDTDLTIMEQTETRRTAISDVKAIFRRTDSDRSGAISREEFSSHVKNPCVQAYFRQLGLDIEQKRNWDGMFDLLDFDNNQEIDIDEFVSGCLHMRGPARSIDLERCNFMMRHIREEMMELKAYFLQNATVPIKTLDFEVDGSASSSNDAPRWNVPVPPNPGAPGDVTSVPVLQIDDL